ncbi:hypothetical protein HGM15179_008673 [Zosterops borbonicus]|uniref:Mitochondrial import receptor subunit TOM7 homolog n=1 Tax=Zosterops borbonicus TaxID=364589 RepID=A0A8K1GH97_9PASS|nr:hypothetical protein HGM15179_008673 [Zosterops borbonicus]
MPKLSKEAKQRLQQLFKGGQFAIRWGFIPVVLYLEVCDPPTLLWPSEATFEVLCRVLGSSVQKGQGEGPAQGHEGD